MHDFAPLETIAGSGRPLLIAGPCSAETEEQVVATATAITASGIPVFRAGLWKPRTKPGGFEGVGEAGLPWMRRVRELTGMRTATEVGSARHAELALEGGVDILWIGARTSANPFAVQEIADVLRGCPTPPPVLVKNPVNPDIELWTGAIERIAGAGVTRLAAVHRGFSAYGHHLYRNLPMWSLPIEMRRRFPTLPMICDPSHIGGRRDLIEPLSQQALDMAFDGLMIECHCRPDEARSDAAQQVTPERLAEILAALHIRRGSAPVSGLEELRRRIDDCDTELLEILSRRMQVSAEIGEFKKANDMPAVQIARHDSIMRSRLDIARRLGLSDTFLRRLMSLIHEESVRRQLEILNPKTDNDG